MDAGSREENAIDKKSSVLARLIESGAVADVILALVVVEAIALYVWHRATGRGLPPATIAAMLIPGACLVLALRAALTGAGWLAVAAWLSAALVAHLVDVTRRLRGR